jgi:hypothetical protein
MANPQSRYSLSNIWLINKPRKGETLKLVEDKPIVGCLFLFSIITKITLLQETMGKSVGEPLWNESR